MNKPIIKSDLPTFLLHWLTVAALVVSFLSGMRIAADAIDAGLTQELSVLWMQGNVIRWHILSAFLLLFIGIAYPLFIIRAGMTNRWSTRSTKKSNNRNILWRNINVRIHWVAFGFFGVQLLTGLLMYFQSGLIADALLRDLHRVIAWGFVFYLVVHVSAHLARGGVRHLSKMLMFRVGHMRIAITTLLLAAVVVTGSYFIEENRHTILVVMPVEIPPMLDGKIDDDIWQHAAQVTVKTVRGANLPQGETKVKIKAVTHKDYSYWLFVWQDETRSQKHLPLQKTEKGWKVLQTEFGMQDEDGFYEDKFAMMLSHSSELAGAGTAHLGPQPLKNKPGALGKRGLHYTEDGSIVDIWHWKSVRTGAINQMDDNFFGPPKPAYKYEVRYKAGYAADPKAGGGFKMNWKYYYDDLVIPKRLPRLEYSPRLGEVDLDQLVSDEGIWAMNWLHTRPWSKENDNYKIGTIIPSVVVDEGMRGDRGDIYAVGKWHDGQWVLEARRKLDTGSKFDVAIKDGVYLWVAVFDHSQTRHSYHLKPVRLTLR
ncbi:MAG: ethylbenzene dehydrogenase-related protein [Pseudomonadales bacterium]|nr:ethylbenzene dehydrogenase-related protein [Pseudomonadales bacterium]